MQHADHSRLRVAYVLKKYPRLSETFILNEILGLEAAGIDVTIHSITAADEGRFHADLSRVDATAAYLPQFKSSAFVDAIEAIASLGLGGPRLERILTFIGRLSREKRHGVAFHGLLLARSLRDGDVDHVHAHFMTVAAQCAYVAHLATGIPFTVTAHAKDIYRESVDASIFAEIANAAHALVTVSEGNREYIRDRYGVTDVVKIFNGLPLDGSSFAGAPGRRDPTLLLGVGRIVEKKGFEDLVLTCRALVDSGRTIRCIIVGDGDRREDIESLVSELDLEGTVTLAGSLPREEVVSLMRSARALVAPFRIGTDGNRDALPTVLIEALALGLPVVAADLNGVPEIVTHDAQGLLVETGDVEALTAAVARLLDEEDTWRRLASAGPVRARERFDRARTIPRLVELFTSSGIASREKTAS